MEQRGIPLGWDGMKEQEGEQGAGEALGEVGRKKREWVATVEGCGDIGSQICAWGAWRL